MVETEKKLFNDFFKKIKNANSVVISRHINPDGDCLGAQYALYSFLKRNFKNKKIYYAGKKTSEYIVQLFPLEKQITCQKFLNKYDLQILVDTSSLDRVDGSVKMGKELIIIDHHSKEDINEDLGIRDTKKSSACEIIANLLFYLKDKKNLELGNEEAKYLFIGIITDTKRLWYNLSSDLLITTSKLLNYNINSQKIYEVIFYWNLNEIRFRNNLISKAKMINNFVYVILEPLNYKPFNLSYQHAKELALTLIEIKEGHYFLIAVKNPETHKYHVSLRSKRKRIDLIAKKFGGGGHKRAAGVRVKNKKILENLLVEMKEYTQK